MSKSEIVSKQLCDFIEKATPNNIISFLRKAGNCANLSLNNVFFTKKEDIKESPYKYMDKDEKTNILKIFFKNNESLEDNLKRLSEDKADSFADKVIINKNLFKKLIDVCVYDRFYENDMLINAGKYFISKAEIESFLDLPIEVKLNTIAYAKKAAYLTLAELYKAKKLDENQRRLSEDIDKVLNNELEIYKSVLVVEHTPEILLGVGLEDLPVLFSQNHIRSCLHEKGRGNKNWHGLNKEDLIDIPNQLEAPAMIMESFTRDDSIVIVTNRVDKDNLPIIAILKANGKGNYDLETVDSNYLTSVYGKDNFYLFVNRGVLENKILYLNKEKIQSLDSSSSLQLASNLSNFESNKILHQIGGLVNTKIEENSISDENYWVVEYNETSSRVPDYKGRVLDETLIEEIKKLDRVIKKHNDLVGVDAFGEITDEWEGCFKFYFDHIENGDVTEHLRIDIGDGNRANLKDFIYLKEQINNKGKKDNVINIKFNM